MRLALIVSKNSSWWASPLWVSGVALDLAMSVLPRTAKLVMLHVISNEKMNLQAEVDATDESDGLQVEIIPFRQDDQPHAAPKRNKHLRLSQPTNRRINNHKTAAPSKPSPPIFISQPTAAKAIGIFFPGVILSQLSDNQQSATYSL